MLPVLNLLAELLGKALRDKLRAEEKIQFVPLQMMRGITFTKAIAVLDEAQNATRRDLYLFASRLGKDSRIIVIGDPEQSDLPGHEGSFGRSQDFPRWLERTDRLEGVQWVKLKSE